jgi:hypothetical protein
MKNCLIWHELCGKEGKLEINFIPARTHSKNMLYLVANLVLYMSHILRVMNAQSYSSAVKIFLCRYNIFAECVTIL